MSTYHLAQVNIARMLAPEDDPVMADFFANIDRINALADAAPGFVWRLQGDEGNATAIRAFEDDFLIINMSVWESVDALHQYTYYSGHAEVFRRRNEWFSKLTDAHMALWWVPAGHIPTPAEAREKLQALRAHGPSAEAFTFKQRFDPPVA